MPTASRMRVPTVLVALAVVASACGGHDEARASIVVDPITRGGDTTVMDLLEVVRSRVNALGVSGSDVTVKGGSVEVAVKARDEALVRRFLATPAVSLEFRPVLEYNAMRTSGKDRVQDEASARTLRQQLGIPDGVTAEQVANDDQLRRSALPEGRPAIDAKGSNKYGIDISDNRFAQLYLLESRLATQVTPSHERRPDKEVELAEKGGNSVHRLGPVALTGAAIEDATAEVVSGRWIVNLRFKAGRDGIDLFNAAAAACYDAGPTCPAVSSGVDAHGQLGIVVDGQILMAPSIQTRDFPRDGVQISGSLTKSEAETLAVALRFGPTRLDFTLRS